MNFPRYDHRLSEDLSFNFRPAKPHMPAAPVATHAAFELVHEHAGLVRLDGAGLRMYVATSLEAATLARKWLADGSRHDLNAPQGVLWMHSALRQQWGVSARQLAQDDILLMESAEHEPLEEAWQWLAAYAEQHARHHAGVSAG